MAVEVCVGTVIVPMVRAREGDADSESGSSGRDGTLNGREGAAELVDRLSILYVMGFPPHGKAHVKGHAYSH